jgi:putative membrane protein
MAEGNETTNRSLDRIAMAPPAPDLAKTPMDVTTRLAYERTFLAFERTLMAWIRTASSLITFGFSIYKFFQLERGAGKDFPSAQVIGPRDFSMMLIVIGLLSLVTATIQHRRQREALKKECPYAPPSTAGLVAGVISVLGLLAIFAVIFRL